MKKLTWIVVLVLIAVALVLVRAKRVRQLNHAPLVEQVPAAVNVVPVSYARVVHTRHVLGTVIGQDEAAVAPRVMARVLTVTVREGAAVQKGQLLATLDPCELQDAVASAEAGVDAATGNLAAAKAGYAARHATTARDKTLFEARAISQEQWDDARAADAAAAARLEASKAELEVARKRLDQARTRLGYCTITAPFSGTISRRLADPGDLAIPGKPLLMMVRQDKVRVRAELPPEDFTRLHAGLPVTLRLGALTFDEPISRVFPAMGPNHLASFEVDLDTPPAGFVSGATVGIDVHLGSAEGLCVPVDALLEGERGSWVFKVTGNTVHPVMVTVQDHSMNRAVIVGNITQGDDVIVARPSRLMTFADGMKVRAMSKNSLKWKVHHVGGRHEPR
ncbi:MAG: efflux RND transporter periplasmic adaptor subunit [Acidobacteria bacterium]|nr:efflux RND transporter periplasmic adaptor subunit [Acidobacteriota bacterium]